MCLYLDLLFAGQTVLELNAGYGLYGRCLIRDTKKNFNESIGIDLLFFKLVFIQIIIWKPEVLFFALSSCFKFYQFTGAIWDIVKPAKSCFLDWV